MSSQKYCPCCGKEIKTEFRKKKEIIDSISYMLGIDAWRITSDKNTLIKMEEAIKKLRKP